MQDDVHACGRRANGNCVLATGQVHHLLFHLPDLRAAGDPARLKNGNDRRNIRGINGGLREGQEFFLVFSCHGCAGHQGI